MTVDVRAEQPPFEAALGSALERVAPVVRGHLAPSVATRRYEGKLRRIWRRGGGPAGRLLAWLLGLHARPGEGPGSPVQLESTIAACPGGATHRWTRHLALPSGGVKSVGLLRFDPARGCLRDRTGRGGWLEVELFVEVAEDGAVIMRSGRQWLRLGPVRLPIPRLLAGVSRAREWQTAAGTLGLALDVQQPLLGVSAGYEVELAEVIA
ncbi:MAG: DUF4166 domain-containing protein [Planctomycetes bacterium]|nr:DUF4166 domain-containing protein [Planctomycetota bacterium]